MATLVLWGTRGGQKITLGVDPCQKVETLRQALLFIAGYIRQWVCRVLGIVLTSHLFTEHARITDVSPAPVLFLLLLVHVCDVYHSIHIEFRRQFLGN